MKEKINAIKKELSIIFENIKDNQKDTIKLNDDEKDITKVKEILLKLETGTSFEVSSNSIEDKEILKAKIEEIKKTIHKLKKEIEDTAEEYKWLNNNLEEDRCENKKNSRMRVILIAVIGFMILIGFFV